jgi:small conductance mechanosensitive channel
MLRLLLAHLLMLGQIAIPSALPGHAAQQTSPEPAITQANTPASAQVNAQDSNQDRSLVALGRSTIARLFRGERKLSPEELGHIEFWMSLIREPLAAAIGFIPRLFVAGVFIVFFWLLYRGIRRVLLGSMTRANVDPSIRDMLGHLIKWTVMGFGLVIAFNQIGIQITALLTGVSIVGLAMGLAAQETLANFIAGIVIFWDKPFRIGDTIEIEGAAGTVQRVTFRSTRLLDADGQVIVLPNTYVLARRLSNQTAHRLRRVNVPVGIAYKESIDAARRVMLDLAGSDPRICEDPPPLVVVSDCADSGVKLILRFWIRDKSIGGPIYFEYMENVKKAFDRAGIQVPFPHMQLLMEQPPAQHELRAAG